MKSFYKVVSEHYKMQDISLHISQVKSYTRYISTIIILHYQHQLDVFDEYNFAHAQWNFKNSLTRFEKRQQMSQNIELNAKPRNTKLQISFICGYVCMGAI